VLTGEKEKNANLFCNNRCDLSPIRDSFNTDFGDPSQPQVFYHECNRLPSSLPRQAFHPPPPAADGSKPGGEFGHFPLR
jgi:hypothetical protein